MFFFKQILFCLFSFAIMRSQVWLIFKRLLGIGCVVRVILHEIAKMVIGLLIFRNQTVLNIQEYTLILLAANRGS
jgi:DMSO/TMAO reductase YedYZ heme-binding membrane subunit